MAYLHELDILMVLLYNLLLHPHPHTKQLNGLDQNINISYKM